jgi:hypothetical protein
MESWNRFTDSASGLCAAGSSFYVLARSRRAESILMKYGMFVFS